MQFNSFVYILLLLPVTVVGYYLCNKIGMLVGKLWLMVASLAFYLYAGIKAAAVLLVSIIINYLFSVLITKYDKARKEFFLIPAVVNVSLLLYFKYWNFALGNINHFVGTEFTVRDIILPLGISFFTFGQIAYLVAVYEKKITHPGVVDYLLYILYFPKLLMGPLMDPIEFISQINDEKTKSVNWDNIACGLKIFSIGLFKKAMIADVFAKAVNWGFYNFVEVTAFEWILIMLFYTFEIYFDFSGYSDMAVGASCMLNIELPMNFNSPYKSLNIRDFWKRWHISLTDFFTRYIYIPLGGSRKGKLFTYLNTMIVFTISGIWHGANFTFILWGILHGILMIFDRITGKIQEKIIAPIRWFFSFAAVNVLWLLFRSESIGQWLSILKTMAGTRSPAMGVILPGIFRLPEAAFFEDVLHIGNLIGNIDCFWMIVYIVGAFLICLIPKNAFQNLKKISFFSLPASIILFIWGIICLSNESVFVYFGF